MCPPDNPDVNKDQSSTLKMLVGGLSLTTVGLLIATIVLATNKDGGCDNAAAAAIETPAEVPVVPEEVPAVPEEVPSEPVESITPVEEFSFLNLKSSSSFYDVLDDNVSAAAEPLSTEPAAEVPAVPEESITPVEEFSFLSLKSSSSFYDVLDDNVCAGAKLSFDNAPCVDITVPQAGANVTKGYVGNMDMGDVKPNTNAYLASKMCPVNVHWHLGSEHYSAGEFDEKGDGPHGNQPLPDWANRDLATDAVRDGFRSSAVGVHGQVFTIVNDESFYYGDMIRGMVVDKDMGKDIHYYTGSTTGTSRDNEMCSQYAPITWQVDRKCHMISASSFDKMCFDMKMQRDDMSGDLHAHGARELVTHDLSANNQYYPDAIAAEEAAPAETETVAAETVPATSFDKMCFDMKMQRDDMSGDLHAHGSRELVNHDLSANNQHYGDRKKKFLRA
eukprot:CAMPEP_0172327648 /NCGR_PEP_ID=MMETSP1058-20130122/59940_1 /TAXON_ID=83371 /ORGANISM="Detonula confervacea, Strain CCMP 353" /LENGTH=445 /DNA_ID=CAMNT_0013044729 /DNA_START=80 /DNA_END=1417 /DNA_ORIENTATION=-